MLTLTTIISATLTTIISTFMITHVWGLTQKPSIRWCVFLCMEMCLGVQRLSHPAKRGTLTDSGPTDSWDSVSSSCSWQACCTPARSALDTQRSSSRSTSKRQDRRTVNTSFKFKIEVLNCLKYLTPLKHSPLSALMQLINLQCATTGEQYVFFQTKAP